MSKNQAVVLGREARKGFYLELLGAGTKVDEVHALVSEAIGAGEHLTTLDSIMGVDDKDRSVLASTISAILVASQEDGRGLTVDAIDSAFSAIDQIAQMDAVQGMEGGEILGSLVALNIYGILSASIDGIAGNIGDLSPVAGATENTKFQVLSMHPMVTKGMGDFVDGDYINPVNASGAMAFSERRETQASVNLTTVYTFNLKKLAGDAGNYPMERGTNDIVVSLSTGDVFVNDYNADPKEAVHTSIITDGGVTFKGEFDYANGTIVMTFGANQGADVPINFTASLSSANLGEISGEVGNEIVAHSYVASAVALNVSASMLDIRQVLQSGRINLISSGLAVAMQKIASESQGMQIDRASELATTFGTVVDLTASSGYANTMEQYKKFMIRVEEASADIVLKSQLTSSIALVGGTALVNIMNASSNNTDGRTITVKDDNNTFRKIGVTANGYPAYYDPRHDIKHPETGGVNKVFVIGTPSDPSKRAVLTGVGLPIMPVDLKIDANSKQVISLQGKTVVKANKDKNSRQLVRVIEVKVP